MFFAALFACSHGQRPTANGERTERFDQPDEAARYFAEKRGITADFDINARYRAARDRMQRMPRAALGEQPAHVAALSTHSAGAWQFLGPNNVGGRTRALLIDPQDPNVMYAGAVSGGVWKTVNAGASWFTTTDFLPNIAVNSLAFDPTDSHVIYAGTGEGYFREDVRGTNLPIRGNGIFVSRDAGGTWQQLPSTNGEDFYWVNDLTVSTHDPQRIYAATRNGVFRSRDGGASWTRVLSTTAKGGCLDLAFRADTANDYLFASCGTLDQATIYRSTNAESDDDWTAVLSEPGMGRTSLAISPSNPSVVYALAAVNGGSTDQGLFAVFRSAQNGDAGTWVAQTRPGTAADQIGPLLLTNVISATDSNCFSIDTRNATQMGWHCNVIAVDPRDANRVWAAGVDLFRSDDGGRTWGIGSYWWVADNLPSFVHADQHAIVFHPGYDGIANQTMLVTNDGGVYRTDNARAGVGHGLTSACQPDRSLVTFRPLTAGFATAQFYGGAASPNGDVYLAGAQDNGSVIGRDDGSMSWRPVFGGDGGYVAIDQEDPNNLYAESQHANLVGSSDGGAHIGPIGPPRNDTFIFICPFIIDPNQHQQLWLGGGHRLWHGEFGVRGWVPASVVMSGSVSALAVARGNPARLLFGTTDGDIHRGDSSVSNGNTDWPAVRPRDGWVSSLTFDPADGNVAYATYAAFGGVHVWKTTDAGATWVPLDGALPDVPAHSLAVDGQHLYLGTDLGIFVSDDGGANWAAESTFPHAITEALVLGRTSRGPALFAFTHGRGAWRVDLRPPPRHRAVRR